MPPKGKGKKKRQQEIPLVHPEPAELDEAEVGMLWETIGAIKPNPLSTGGHEYTFATAKAFDAGPPVPQIVGYLTPTIPLIGNPSSISAARAQTAASQSVGSGGGVASPIGSPSHAYEGTVTFPTTAVNSGGGFYGVQPKPPPRHIKDGQRANYRLHANEKNMREGIKRVQEHLENHRGFWLMMSHELLEFYCEKKTLFNDIIILEVKIHFSERRNDAKLDEQLHEFNTDKFRLESTMDELIEKEPEVQEALAEKRSTLDERRCREDELFQMQRAHLTTTKNLTKELKAERDRLEDLMNQRLARTTDEMSKLTSTQREERQKRAQEESNRLVAELSVLERRSKHLNDRSLKFQKQADSTRRDRELEQHRRALLIQKNHTLGEDVKRIVGELQDLEQQIATNQLAAVAGQKAAHELAMDKVDQQYESIAFLRTELEKVRSDTESIHAKIRECQRALLAEAGGKHLPITLPSPRKHASGEGGQSNRGGGYLAIEGRKDNALSPAATSAVAVEALRSLDDNTSAAIRAVILDAVKDTNEAMQRMPIHNATSIFTLKDPSEKLLVQHYVSRRVMKLLSCIYPSAPPFSFLRTAAQNPSSLATSL